MTDSFEFYVYDDTSWQAMVDERWPDVRDRLAQWVLTEQLDVIDVVTDKPLTFAEVQTLDAEMVRRSLVKFVAHDSLAAQMRMDPAMQQSLADAETPQWAVSFSSTMRGVLPRRDAASMQPPCSPSEMPDLRLTLIDAWQRPSWRQTARMGIARARAIGTAALRDDRSLTSATDSYCAFEQRTLRQAEMWWVGPEMCDLLYATASKVPLDVTMEHLELPSVTAFVVFAKPWSATDADTGKRTLVVDAITWGPAKLVDDRGERHALGVSAYRMLDFGAGLSPTELQLATATGSFDHAKQTLKSVSVDDDGQKRSDVEITGKVWAPLGRSDWPLTATVGDTDEGHDEMNPLIDTTKAEAYAASAVEDRQLVAALSLLLHTRTMTQLEPGHLPRQTRRRSERAGVPSTVNVVYVRRPERSHDDHEHDDTKPPVEWSHRWIVGAHPRLQAYGPGRSMRRLIMVPPHVKGPSDKPLVVKPTVNAWVR